MSSLASAAYAVLLFVVGVILAAAIDESVRSKSATGRIRVSMRPLLKVAPQLLTPDPGHKRIDRVLFLAAAPVALAAVLTSLIIIPASAGADALAGPQLTVGVFFFLVILDFMAVALYMAGWGANHPSGTNGATLAAAQLVSYIVPLGFAVTGAVMAAASLSSSGAVQAQSGIWFGAWQPFGFAIYLVAAFGQTYRPPANLPLSDDSDVLVEHRGAGEALLRFALYGIWFATAAMGTVLFLGGWRGPWLPGPVWFFLKTAVLLAAMAWIGTRFERLTPEQVLRGAWLVLIPASILNIIIVGVILMVWQL